MRVLFCGTPEFAAAILETLLASRHTVVGVVSQPSRPRGRGLQVEDPPAVRLARAAGIAVFQTPRIHAADTLQAFRELRPEVIVTAAFGRILRRALLDLTARGCWNVHASLLPRHRGASPVTGALLAGDAWTGVTLFRLDEGLDTGPILLQEMIPIAPEATAGDLADALSRLGGRLLVEALDREEAFDLTPMPQPGWGATYAPILAKEDGLIGWNRPVEQIDRLVRAVTPWPGAFTFLEGKRLRIHRARPRNRLDVASAGDTAASGRIVPLGDRFGVLCLPGLLEILELQSEGRKRQEAADWLRGNRAAIGAHLEPTA